MRSKKRSGMGPKQANSDRFTSKAMELPMVSSSYHQALDYYQWAKKWSPLVNWSLSLAENAVKIAAGTAQPIVGAPLTKADQMAAEWLQYVENKYPAIKKTPEEMKASYYVGSRLQKGIESANEAKNFGFQQVTKTRNAVDFAVHNPSEAAMSTIRYSIVAINWALDNVESAVDRHIAKNDAQKGSDRDHSTVAGRLSQIYEKTTDGVKFHAAHYLDSLKNSVNEQIKQIPAAIFVIDFARRQSEAATKQVGNFWEDAKEKSAATTLSTTKFLTQSFSQTTERISNFAGPYLPETGRKSLTTANDYAKDVARTFNEAKSLTEVKEEVMTKAKLKLDAIEKKLGAIEFANFAIANLTNVWDFVMQRNKIGEQKAPDENSKEIHEAVRPTENRSHQEPKIADESALFDRPATMMFLKPDGSVKQKQHGKIQIVGDSEMSGFRIRFINETDGIVALDQVITMQMKVKIITGKTGNFVEWNGWDLAAGEALKRNIKLQLSNKSAVGEFAEIFNKGVQLAELNQISEEQISVGNSAPIVAPKEISAILRAPQLNQAN